MTMHGVVTARCKPGQPTYTKATDTVNIPVAIGNREAQIHMTLEDAAKLKDYLQKLITQEAPDQEKRNKEFGKWFER